MSKPTDLSPHLRWATAPLIPADVTEPDTTHKDQGWQNAEEPPHSYFNYWMKLVYLWVAYLDGLTNEALTWTAAHIFNAGVTITTAAAQTALTVTGVNGKEAGLFKAVGASGGTYGLHVRAMAADGAGAAAEAIYVESDGLAAIQANNLGSGGSGRALWGTGDGLSAVEGHGYNAVNTSDRTAPGGVIGQIFAAPYTSWQAGVIGKGMLGQTAGVMGLGGDANSGTIPGGFGGRFVGGDQAGASTAGHGLVANGGKVTGTTGVIAGRGAAIAGGDITNGAGNAAGASGYGAVIKGGDILGDTHGRFGSAALALTGGLGQAGYGPAVYADHGGIVLAEGNIVADNNLTPHVLGSTQIDGQLEVVGAFVADSAVAFAGSVTANGTLTTNALVTANAPVITNNTVTANGTLVTNGAHVATGGIVLPGVTPITPTAPFTAGVVELPGFWRDAFGMVGCQGGLTPNAATGVSNPAFTLPVGFRPLQQCVFELPNDSTGNVATAIVHTTGVVNLRFGVAGGFVGDIFLDAIRFRTT